MMKGLEEWKAFNSIFHNKKTERVTQEIEEGVNEKVRGRVKPGLVLVPELPSGKFAHYLQSQLICQLSVHC